MVSLFNGRFCHVGILSLALTTFCMTHAVPVYATQVNEVAFMMRVEKLVEKLKKMKKSTDSKKMMDLALDIKAEIESSYSVKFNLDDCFKTVESNLKANGVNVSKDKLTAIQKMMKKKDKEVKSKTYCLSSSMYTELPDYEIGELSLHHEAKTYGKKDKDQDDEEVSIPAKLTWGVTLTLVGVFLNFLPIPACKSWGQGLILMGVGVCGDCITGKMDEDEK